MVYTINSFVIVHESDAYIYFNCFNVYKFIDDDFIVQLEKLSDTQCQPESQLKFIIEAWQQVNLRIVTIYF